MMDELEQVRQYMPQVLIVLGALLQFLMRSRRVVPEWAYFCVAGLVVVGSYILFNQVGDEGWRMETVHAVLGVSQIASELFGGTFLASKVASGVVAMNPAAASHPLVPLTDSK